MREIKRDSKSKSKSERESKSESKGKLEQNNKIYEQIREKLDWRMMMREKKKKKKNLDLKKILFDLGSIQNQVF